MTLALLLKNNNFPDEFAAAPDLENPHPSTYSGFKRFLDIVGSLVGLLVLALVLVPISIAIKLDNTGPIFYTQQRHGLHGQAFTIYKFRSMVANADALKALVNNEANGLIFKNTQDPRITRVGRFLRKTSLDELPQFWNVLLGDMSLVGTRPPTTDEVIHYQAHHWQRLNVKPGITGEWQVNGRSQVTDFEDIVSFDLHYQRQWTPWYDLAILLKTLYIVFAKVGAC
ncbi:sugar transferase [Oscillatoriales cyanobacterium LEGE 11467]|uniref:Sugar transferase n=1 Tax=Zarconia navalis LEGE 11467 TaxID=1828826 RepID=A0A928VZD8_9CYAN|nr:sugar transferase [Zarconia navalis]MBE9041116.1 sugar transferase [Zarconia navalis LEGE 11467]